MHPSVDGKLRGHTPARPECIGKGPSSFSIFAEETGIAVMATLHYVQGQAEDVYASTA